MFSNRVEMLLQASSTVMDNTNNNNNINSTLGVCSTPRQPSSPPSDAAASPSDGDNGGSATKAFVASPTVKNEQYVLSLSLRFSPCPRLSSSFSSFPWPTQAPAAVSVRAGVISRGDCSSAVSFSELVIPVRKRLGAFPCGFCSVALLVPPWKFRYFHF